MIKLYLAIGKEGTIPMFEFENRRELREYIKNLEQFSCVWLCCGEAPNSEIVITESLGVVLKSVINSTWQLEPHLDSVLHIHEYQSYEDAYAVALDMREGNPRCYN